MAGSFYNSGKDSVDISELASLNEDISDDLIEQLQNQLTPNAQNFKSEKPAINPNDDSTLFEESSSIDKSVDIPKSKQQSDSDLGALQNLDAQIPAEPRKEEITVNKNFDDNFIKKYKAKLNKKAGLAYNEEDITGTSTANTDEQSDEPIENLSQGNISERPLTQEQKNYNDSLDFLDGNVKYSKYVIYIDPQNVDFIEGLTVKERKNLINSILREQDDIAITKRRFKTIQTVMRHVIIAILTLAISIPVVYNTINASLEATIDNHRRSQTNWQTLYKEHGKITPH